MDTLINLQCTYFYKIDKVKKEYNELLKKQNEIEEDFKDLLDSDEDPYYFQSNYIIIKTQLEDLNEKINTLLEYIKTLRYEISN